MIIEDLIFDFIKIGIVNKDFISNIILECNHNYIISSHNYIECINNEVNNIIDNIEELYKTKFTKEELKTIIDYKLSNCIISKV